MNALFHIDLPYMYKSVSEPQRSVRERSQTGQEQTNGSDLDEGLTTRRESLIIASKPAIAYQPTEGSFHDPSFALHLKSAFGFLHLDRLAIDKLPLTLWGIGVLWHDFGFPTQLLTNPIAQGPS